MQLITDNQVRIKLSAKICTVVAAVAVATAAKTLFSRHSELTLIYLFDLYKTFFLDVSFNFVFLFHFFFFALHCICTMCKVRVSSSQWNVRPLEKVKCNHINSNNFSSNDNYPKAKKKETDSAH